MRKISILFAIYILAVCSIKAQKTDNQLQTYLGEYEDVQSNSVSEVQFKVTNTGKFPYSQGYQSLGIYWPRGSQNNYIYDGELIFSYNRINTISGETKYFTVCPQSNDFYALSNGGTIPGKIIDDGFERRFDLLSKNRIYKSSDFNRDGTPAAGNWGPNWTLWRTNNSQAMQFGVYAHTYVSDTTQRNISNYSNGPLFVSDEDVFLVYKDSLQSDESMVDFQVSIYSWSNEYLKDVVVAYYTIENNSQDTLYNCWLAPEYGSAIGTYSIGSDNYPRIGNDNDRFRYFIENPSMNLAVLWSDATNGDENKGLGYAGIALIESPAVDANGFIRNDKTIFLPNEQLGLKTCRRWDYEYSMGIMEDYYKQFIESNIKESQASEPQKTVVTLGTGPFNLLPGNKARLAVALSFAAPSKGGEADGTTEDISGGLVTGKVSNLQSNTLSLTDKVNYVKTKYYQALELSVGDNQVTNINIDGVFPNPASKMITLNYHLQKDDFVNIGLYNQLGEEVQNFYTGWQSGGKLSNQYQLNTNNLSAGIYYVRIQSTNEIKTKAVSITK